MKRANPLKNLPLKSQILLAPAVIIFLIMGLIGFTLAKLTDIKHQNETVREWVRVCEHAQAAISAGQRMTDVARRMEAGTLDKDDDLHFSYLEQSRVLSENLNYAELVSRLTPDTLTAIKQQEHLVKYNEQLDPQAVLTTMEDFLPRLEHTYRGFWVQKRAAYTDYYDNVNHITSQLATISLYVLAASVFMGIALSYWTIRRTKGRLGALARDAKSICAGNLTSPPAPETVRDEVDELALCMSTMTQRLLKVVATEKVLEGAEDERKRIAMDMHDQTLSDLTALSRELHALAADPSVTAEQRSKRLQAIETELEDVSNNIRRIIDDLHPQTLDMLGLENALRSYLEKRLTGPQLPDYFLHIDRGLDEGLTEFERLNLYRICLVAIDNVIRHSACTRYEIECRRNRDVITLIVEDNGRGFDFDLARKNGGHGLTNIEERAKAIGASASWSPSRFSSGTRFELRLDTRNAHKV
jgi:two-component system sensor histidine kinase UhpB